MKLFILAVLISAASAASLDHLERGYLPPAQNNYAANSGRSTFPGAGAHGSFGLGGQGSQYTQGRGSNGFSPFESSNEISNGFGSKGSGFGNNGRGSNGFGSGSNGASGRNGFSGATSNQYLPPNYGSSGSNGGSSFGSIRPACSTCGSSNFGSPQRYQQGNSFGSQGLSIPSTQYGSPQSFTPGSFGSQGFTSQGETSGASRQYLAPKQNIPQQPFDENTGYIY